MTLRAFRAKLLLLAWWSGVYLPPDRRVLEKIILRRLATDPSYGRVLSVGVKFYTRRYGANFRPGTWVTMDRDPAVRRHGSAEHVVESLENIARVFPSHSFDAIIVNGVIGWGLDAESDVNRALIGCGEILKPGGALVLGLNERRSSTPDLSHLDALRHFEPWPFPGIDQARLVIATPFDEREHTFLFFRKRPPAV